MSSSAAAHAPAAITHIAACACSTSHVDAVGTGEPLGGRALQDEPRFGDAAGGVLALDGDTVGRGIDHEDARIGGDDDPLRVEARGHAHLLAREPAVAVGRRRRGERVAHRLDERGGDDARAVGDTFEMLVAAEVRERGRAEPHHRERGHRRRRAPDLLQHDARLEEAEPAAADRLGQRDADEAGVGHRAPQLVVDGVARWRAPP